MKAVFDGRDTDAGERTNNLAQWKGPLDDQLNVTAGEKATKDAANATLAEKEAELVTA